MDEPGEMVVDPAMGRVLEALDGGWRVDPFDLTEVLSRAEADDLAGRGKKWLLIALWQAQYRVTAERGAVERANARANTAEARVRELENQMQPLISRNRALNNALLTIRRAMQISAIEDSK